MTTLKTTLRELNGPCIARLLLSPAIILPVATHGNLEDNPFRRRETRGVRCETSNPGRGDRADPRRMRLQFMLSSTVARIHTSSGKGGVTWSGIHNSRGPGFGRSGDAWGYSSRTPFGPLGGFPFIPFAPFGSSGFWGPSGLPAPQSGIQVVIPTIVLNGGDNDYPDANPPPRPLPQATDDDLPRGAKGG